MNFTANLAKLKKKTIEKMDNLCNDSTTQLIAGLVVLLLIVIICLLVWAQRKSSSGSLAGLAPANIFNSSATSSANKYVLTNTL